MRLNTWYPLRWWTTKNAACLIYSQANSIIVSIADEKNRTVEEWKLHIVWNSRLNFEMKVQLSGNRTEQSVVSLHHTRTMIDLSFLLFVFFFFWANREERRYWAQMDSGKKDLFIFLFIRVSVHLRYKILSSIRTFYTQGEMFPPLSPLFNTHQTRGKRSISSMQFETFHLT